jgi:small subunit ribosomal protein S16
MPVRIRLSRPPGATKLTTHYHIVAVHAKKRRDAKPLEILGIYDPALKSRYDKSKGWTVEDAFKALKGLDAPPVPDRRIEWSVDRLRYWVGVGAEPTKTVVHLLDFVSDSALVFFLWRVKFFQRKLWYYFRRDC